MDFNLQPTFGGAVLAAMAVAGGGPLFGEGLRVLRLGRAMARLEESRLGDTPSGFVRTRGRVALEAPLFTPLSGKPCAGFRIEVGGLGHHPLAAIEERRPFRLADRGFVARVAGGWSPSSLPILERREVPGRDTLPTGLAALLARSAEARWLRRTGVTLVLTERALLAGEECHVIGQARPCRPFEIEAEPELLKTGTDGGTYSSALEPGTNGSDVALDGDGSAIWTRTRAGRHTDSLRDSEPDLWIDGGGHLDFLYVSDRAPGARDLALPWIRSIGLVLGPALSLGGLIYLANAADHLRTAGRP
ncbi:MAG TPA: hypothetical protein VGK93_06455 [Candidatus Eisenbacteria bacterium]|jgi:hypothetical protein